MKEKILKLMAKYAKEKWDLEDELKYTLCPNAMFLIAKASVYKIVIRDLHKLLKPLPNHLKDKEI